MPTDRETPFGASSGRGGTGLMSSHKGETK